MHNSSAKSSDSGAMMVLGALLFALLWRIRRQVALIQHQHLAWVIGLSSAGLIIVVAALYLLKNLKLKRSQLRPSQWPKMSGLQFEDQVVIWLKSQGYDPVLKTEYFDKGLDIIAAKSGLNFGVQVKRSTRPVGVAAVRAVVAGLSSYRCDRAMVVTNASFTAQARSLARANDCDLIGGNELRSKYMRVLKQRKSGLMLK